MCFMCLCCLLLLVALGCGTAANPYILDDTGGLGRVFDGIGGLSGGGATSRLLVSYPPKQRDEILDFLFLPNFAASLHILKVEIGGDAQSTDGTESSHMHTADDGNYQRGYEWWLMTEAKKRNPDIKLYALSWAFPSWVGNNSGSPYTYPKITAGYIIEWIKGAKRVYNLDIDYIGIWNERRYDSTYIKVLRKMLDAVSLQSVVIVASDADFKPIADDVVTDAELSAAVGILGAHYPGTNSTDNAMKSGKPLWASEDYSTFNDDTGAGCWARILNQNYVTGHMTSTISWNLIASYYSGLPFYGDGLMTAVEPWSGHYEDSGPIWISAHTTQFVKPGIHYLAHGQGVGYLDSGGSFVTFFDSTTNDFTIVIETMSHNHSVCIRPRLPEYDVQQQTAVFQLKGKLATKAPVLSQWMSAVSSGLYFQKMSPVQVDGSGKFSVNLPVDTVITLSTLKGQAHSTYKDVPASKPFPVPYKDDFVGYHESSEAQYFADQTGVFEISIVHDLQDHQNWVMRQMITSRPITWCDDAKSPITIIGDHSWKSMSFSVMVMLEASNTSVFIAGGVSEGGCSIANAGGVFAFVNSSGQYVVTADLAMKKVLTSGVIDVKLNTWYTLSMTIDAEGKTVSLKLDTVVVKLPLPVGYSGGYVGMGTGGFYHAMFDNFELSSAK